MRRFVHFLFLGFLSLTSLAQSGYPVDSIPAHLRAGANAVVRTRQTRIDIINPRKSEAQFKEVVTLLNDEAGHYRLYSIPYNPTSRISNIRAVAYDETGKLIWNLQPYNIVDRRDTQGPEELSDSRQKTFEIPAYNYPFTFEVSYTTSLNETYVWSRNMLQFNPEESLEESGLQFIVPSGMHFNHKTLNLKNPTDILQSGKSTIYTWKEENLPASRQRPYAQLVTKKMPVVYATPLDFSMHGYQGSFQSWKSYGNWVAELIKGRDELEPQYAEKAREVVKGITDRKEKVRSLYSYMQAHTRYFYIGFGIGGNQPMPANEVARNGYGDCKALSNYMMALLKAVDIESHYTLVNSGALQYIEPGFPSDQFDHIILCVPDQKDTIWLECTDQTQPFNYLGTFTCDRDVLMVTPEGGKIARTPKYGIEYNQAQSFANIELAGSGDVEVNLTMNRSGLLYDELYAISESKTSERKEWLSDQIGSKGVEVTHDSYGMDNKGNTPQISAAFSFKTRNYASKSSDRLFVSPALVSGISYIQEDPSEISIDVGLRHSDSSRIEIPIGYQVEFVPGNVTFATKFGCYARTLRQDNRYVYYSRRIEIMQADYPMEDYREFYDFVSDMAKNDQDMVVLRSK